MLRKLKAQRTASDVAADSVTAHLDNGKPPCIACSQPGARICGACGACCGPTALEPAPRFGNLSESASFAIEIVLDTSMHSSTLEAVANEPILDCRNKRTGQGVVLLYSRSARRGAYVNLSMSDQHGSGSSWGDLTAPLWLRRQHHLVFNVDGLSRVVSVVVDGVLSDGGSSRSQGWTHIGARDYENVQSGIVTLDSVDGATSCVVHPSVALVRTYGRCLLTSEAIGNWRAWRKT